MRKSFFAFEHGGLKAVKNHRTPKKKFIRSRNPNGRIKLTINDQRLIR